MNLSLATVKLNSKEEKNYQLITEYVRFLAHKLTFEDRSDVHSMYVN